jgi:hypothetical protein
MLTLKESVAAAILVGAVAATAGITYVATKTTVTVSCPSPPVAAAPPSASSALPTGAPVQPYHGKQW